MTIRVRVKNGEQIIVPIRFARAVTVQGGLPVPVTTPGHGTAYDIAGQGVARTGSTEQAYAIACRMGASRRAA